MWQVAIPDTRTAHPHRPPAAAGCTVGPTDCAQTIGCKAFGQCTSVAGRCRLTSSADCQTAGLCTTEGLCQLADHACAALADTDCGSSVACLAHDRCRAHAGRCVREPSKEQP